MYFILNIEEDQEISTKIEESNLRYLEVLVYHQYPIKVEF